MDYYISHLAGDYLVSVFCVSYMFTAIINIAII